MGEGLVERKFEIWQKGFEWFCGSVMSDWVVIQWRWDEEKQYWGKIMEVGNEFGLLDF